LNDQLTAWFRDAAAVHGIQAWDYTQPASGFVTANGLRFHYVDWGGNGIPMLFLHGGNQTARTWDLVCVRLCQQYHCYALDQRNHGESDHVATSPAATGPYEQAEDIHGVIQALGLRQVVLVGMSMGGFNTMAYAAKHPECVQAAVIVDVSPTIRTDGVHRLSNSTGQREFATYEDAVAYAAKSNPRRPVAHLRYTLWHALKQQPNGTWVWRHERPHNVQRPDQQQAVEAELRRQRFASLWEDVARITCPALVVRGGNSPILAEQDAERLVRALPHGTLVTIPDSGHTVQGDCPKQLGDEIERFLARAVQSSARRE
jgi:pimeloyl-ACP methyl ester carboxylesterase